MRLDSIFQDYYQPGDRAYMKIDVQGYEKHVIEGAEAVLDSIVGVQMEVSLVPLYEEEELIGETIKSMSDKGYILMGLEPGFFDRTTGQLLQADCIFFRK